ncbi:hypothetical protein SPF06_01060 [Sinomonas sp. JGH33]|uniref:DUF3168 domain-containing protein n=1 Tax=Sinomonas terricola TaxID=3110330 RepID=A0ABU5T0W5_9MICC|nr:hypothetical protein [Sinomonas sp. JGH33]MEA5453300.1 hypothetical protein [Sinomonas sp. JGH33]
MATVASRIPATIDALISTWRAAALTVWDGPVPEDNYRAAIFVGYDAAGVEESAFASANVRRVDWGPIGNRARDEEFSIICAAVALGDGTSYKSARDAAFALVNSADAAVRPKPSDPSLGLLSGVAPYLVAAIRVEDFFQEPTENAGPQARVVFAVDVKTRI